VLLFLCLIATVFAAPSLESVRGRFSDLKTRSCIGHSDVNSCIGGNDFFHPKPHGNHVACLWCHSHATVASASHCATLDNVRTSQMYQSDWVCDYQMPVSNHGKHHGLSVDTSPLDVEDPYGMKSGGKSGMMGKMMGKMMGDMMGKGKDMMGKGKDMMGKGTGMMGKGTGMMGKGTGMMGKGKDMMPDNSISGQVKNFMQNAPKSVQFLGGLAMGVLGAIPFQPTKVIAGIDAVQNDINNLMSKFSVASAGALGNDVVLVATTIKDMAGLLQAAGAPEVAEKAAAVVAKADNPIGWVIGAGELALNGVNVYQDFTAALNAYKTGDNFEMGKRIGDLISILAG